MRTHFTLKSKMLRLLFLILFYNLGNTGFSQLSELHESFDDVSAPLLPDGWISNVNVSISNTIAEVKTVHHASAPSQPNALFLMNGLDGSNGQLDANAFVTVVSPLVEVGEFGARLSFTASGGQPITLGILTDASNSETFTELETFTLTSDFQEFSYEFTEAQTFYLAFKNSNQTTVNPVFVDEVIFEQSEGPEVPITEFHESFDEIDLPFLPEKWKANIDVLISNTIAEVKTVHHGNAPSQPNAVFLMNGLDGSNGQTDADAFVSVVSPLIQILEHGAKVTFSASGGNSIVLGIMTDATNSETFTGLDTYELNSDFQTFSYEITEPQIGYLVFKNGNENPATPVFVDEIIFEQLEGPELPLTEYHESFDDVSLPSLPERWKTKVDVLISNTIAEVKTVHHADAPSQPNAVFIMNGLDGSNGQADETAFAAVISPLSQVLEYGAKITFSASGGNSILLGIMEDATDIETFTELESFELNSDFQTFSYEITEPQIGYLVFKNGNENPVTPVFVDEVIFEQLEEMSIKNFEQNDLSIFPNPTRNKIRILSESSISKIELLDLSGKKLLEKKLNSTETSVNMNQLPKGIYLIQITSGNTKQIKKVIKN